MMFREVRLRPGRRGGDALIAADNFKLFAGAGAGGWKWSVTSGLGSDVIRHQPTTDPYLVTRANARLQSFKGSVCHKPPQVFTVCCGPNIEQNAAT